MLKTYSTTGYTFNSLVTVASCSSWASQLKDMPNVCLTNCLVAWA